MQASLSLFVAALPWTKVEQSAVLKHLGHFIQLRKAPRKLDCVNCIMSEPALSRRTWIDLKNHIASKVHYARLSDTKWYFEFDVKLSLLVVRPHVTHLWYWPSISTPNGQGYQYWLPNCDNAVVLYQWGAGYLSECTSCHRKIAVWYAVVSSHTLHWLWSYSLNNDVFGWIFVFCACVACYDGVYKYIYGIYTLCFH